MAPSPSMDVNPAPIPGKRRPLVKRLPNREDDVKVSKKPPWQSLTAAQTRPKRAFGVDRSSNIPAEKPLAKPSLPKLDKAASKPRKPAVVASTKATKKTGPAPPAAAKVSPLGNSGRSGSNPAKVSPLGNSGRSGSNPAKVDARKHLRVSFQEANPKPRRSIGKNDQEVVLCTPMSLAKTVLPETPYQTAWNCSKCRLDKLETATYWLAQIKLAELVGKHFVSAALFSLALQCQAQPFPRLQSELRRYMVRHQVISADSVWAELSQSYGLSTNKPNADIDNLDQSEVLLAGEEDSSSEHDACSSKFGHVRASFENDDLGLSFHDKLLICGGHEEGCMGHRDCNKIEEVGMEEANTKSSNASTASDVKDAELIEDLCEIESGNTAETPNPSVDASSEHNSYAAVSASISNCTVSGEQKVVTASKAASELSDGKSVNSRRKIKSGASGGDRHKMSTNEVFEKENDPK